MKNYQALATRGMNYINSSVRHEDDTVVRLPDVCRGLLHHAIGSLFYLASLQDKDVDLAPRFHKTFNVKKERVDVYALWKRGGTEAEAYLLVYENIYGHESAYDVIGFSQNGQRDAEEKAEVIAKQLNELCQIVMGTNQDIVQRREDEIKDIHGELIDGKREFKHMHDFKRYLEKLAFLTTDNTYVFTSGETPDCSKILDVEESPYFRLNTKSETTLYDVKIDGVKVAYMQQSKIEAHGKEWAAPELVVTSKHAPNKKQRKAILDMLKLKIQDGVYSKGDQAAKNCDDKFNRNVIVGSPVAFAKDAKVVAKGVVEYIKATKNDRGTFISIDIKCDETNRIVTRSQNEIIRLN